MTAAQTTFETELAGLVDSSFATFCEETGAMFGWEMESEQKDVCVETVNGLKKRFKKLCAVYAAQSDGALNGTFQIIFDHKGLFTLGGMIVMLPENRMVENRKHGTAKEADEIGDAVKEAGNMLIGSLDKVFREDLKGHGHLLHTNTFIGEPWDKSDESIGLGIDEEFLYVACEMTIETYPAFQCGIIFPKKVYDHSEKQDAEQPVNVESEPQDDTEQQNQAMKTENDPSDQEIKPEEKNETEESVADTNFRPEENVSTVKEEQLVQSVGSEVKQESSNTENSDSAPAEKTEVKSESDESVTDTVSPSMENASATENERPDKTVESDVKEEPSNTANDDSLPEEKPKVESESEKSMAEEISLSVQNESTTKDEQSERVIGSDIKKELPDNITETFSHLCARDIMQENVLWCSSEESVGKVLAKMCQDDINYALIGSQVTLEGIVSMSDLRAGMSPYLRPEFAKWRRPIDDASLRIKVRWLMSKKIHTVKSWDRLSDVVLTMCRLGLRSMPVVTQNGQIEGIINVFDVLRTLSCSDKEIVSNI